MSDLTIAIFVVIAWLEGLVIGYIMWAPTSPFKQAFMDGLSLKFIWGKFVK